MGKIKKTMGHPHLKVGVCKAPCFLDDPKSKTLKLLPHSKECGFRFMDIKKLLGSTLVSLALLTGSDNLKAETNSISSRSFTVKTGYFSPLAEFYGEKPIDYRYYRTDFCFEKTFENWKRFRTSLDFSVINVDRGFGSFYAGPGISLSYKLFEKGRFSAGLKGGWSVFYNDAYKTENYNGIEQNYVGSVMEFDSKIGIELGWRYGKDAVFVVESSIEHISNAGLSSRNEGINTLGFMAGIRRNF